jgi:DNA-binding winged helix-turn-helix (wHTH) protein/tetratricopeptide (TPR) repeat protein
LGGQALAFHGVVFGDDFATATRPDGAALRFTRQERTLLTLMAPNPGRLFSRAELYAAIGSAGSDRNVDFLVNRLRAKLGDTAAERRFIATQYGEGYVWVATAAACGPEPAFLVIEPLRGQADEDAERLLRPLAAALAARLSGGRGVVVAPEADPKTAPFVVEASLHPLAERTHAAFVLRHGPARAVAATFRETFAAGDDPAPAIARLAEAITDALWRRLAMGPDAPPTPTDPPLHLRMLDASALLDPPGVTWLANGEQLARLRGEHPEDPAIALMWAMHLYAKMTLVPGPEPLSRAVVDKVDDEIEALVLRHLSAVRGDPVLALAAAKLLLLRQRSRTDLAESLAIEAFAGSTAFAAAFPMLGQVRAYRGDFAEAQRLYDEGLQLSPPGSAFEQYIRMIKAIAYVAADDQAAAAEVFERIVEAQPFVLELTGLLFLPPGDDGLARRLAPIADRADLATAKRAIAYLYFRAATHFQHPAHVANIMRGPLIHLVRRLGPQVASDEIWSELPAELLYLRSPRWAVAGR